MYTERRAYGTMEWHCNYRDWDMVHLVDTVSLRTFRAFLMTATPSLLCMLSQDSPYTAHELAVRARAEDVAKRN